MARPKLLGIEYAPKAAPVVEEWRRLEKAGSETERRLAKAKLKSLRTFETRALANPLGAGDPVARDHWPRDLLRDYGADVPNLFRLELTDRWRAYYSLVGEPGGVRVWVLYVWDHRTYSRQSGYAKR